MTTQPIFDAQAIRVSTLFLPISAVEYVGTGSRTYPLLALMSSYCAASLAVPFVARALSSWRPLLAVAAAPALAVPLLAWKVLPESPGWLLCKGRVDAARRELEWVARVNGRNGKVRMINPTNVAGVHLETGCPSARAAQPILVPLGGTVSVATIVVVSAGGRHLKCNKVFSPLF